MFCSKCGSPLIEGAEYCSKCGTAVATIPTATPQDVHCEKCGYKLGPHNTKCLHCGTPRPGSNVAPVAPPARNGCQVPLIIGGLVCMLILARVLFTSPSASRSTRSVLPASSGYDVTYRVTGTTSEVSLTIQNASGNTEQIGSARVPWERSFTSSGGFVYVAAQNQKESGTVHCEILVDGRVIETANSSGAYTIATCSGNAR